MTRLTVLTSAVGLGAYVAALLHHRQLRDAGHDADVEVIEGWFTEEHLARHLTHQAAFHHDFRLAQAGRAMAGSVDGRLDAPRIEALLAGWRAEGRERFFTWSGYWLAVLERYAASAPELGVTVDLCFSDSVASDSFRAYAEPAGCAVREHWLFNAEQHALSGRLPVPAGAPIPFDDRQRRLVAHGGGWGLGTYPEVLAELSAAGYGLDILGPGPLDQDRYGPRDRRFVPDPDWHPWRRDVAGELTFPPLGELGPGGEVRWATERDFAPAHVNVRGAMAVVSKPGGGTLIDSLAAATPVVFLTPWGRPEARNAELWEELGFGIDFVRWRDTGFDAGVLADLHRRLLDADAPDVHPLLTEVPA